MKPYVICCRDPPKHPIGYAGMRMNMPVERNSLTLRVAMKSSNCTTTPSARLLPPALIRANINHVQPPFPIQAISK